MLLKLILESKKIVADLITSSEEELMDTYKYGGKITYKGKDVTKEINEIIEMTEHDIKVDLEENGTYNRGNTEYTETEVTHLENVYIGYNPDKDTLNLMFEVEWQEESEMYYDNDYDVDYDDDYDDYDDEYETEIEEYKGTAYISFYNFGKNPDSGESSYLELKVGKKPKQIVKQFKGDKVLYQNF
jgi:hypothetical protein